MPRINVFISHASEDEDYIEELRGMLQSYDLDIANYSIDSSKPNEAENDAQEVSFTAAT